MSTNVYIALCINSQNIMGGIISPSMTILERFQSSHQAALSARCTEAVNLALAQCKEKNLTPISLGIATKGEVHNGFVTLHQREQPVPLKQILQQQFRLPTVILNRFHAFSYGVYHLENPDASSVFATILASDGVGSGVINRGTLDQTYDSKKGVGGLRAVKRYSDEQSFPIAQIASSKALQDGANELLRRRYSVHEIFAMSDNKNAQIILKDAADAIAELAHDLWKSSQPSRIVLSPYPQDGLSKEQIETFTQLVNYQWNKFKREQAPLIESFFCDKTQDEIKMLGVSKFTLTQPSNLQHYLSQQSAQQTSSLFAITGVPGCGKTTFLKKILAHLQKEGLKVGGMFSQEVRNPTGKRIGFNTHVISHGQPEQIFELAILKDNVQSSKDYANFGNTPYAINIKNISNSIIPALLISILGAQVIVLDEIANMQLNSREFQDTISAILLLAQNSNVPVIVTIPMVGNHQTVQKIRQKTQSQEMLWILEGQKELAQNQALQRMLPIIGTKTQSAPKEGMPRQAIEALLQKLQPSQTIRRQRHD